jgi:hypothetical protein
MISMRRLISDSDAGWAGQARPWRGVGN